MNHRSLKAATTLVRNRFRGIRGVLASCTMAIQTVDRRYPTITGAGMDGSARTLSRPAVFQGLRRSEKRALAAKPASIPPPADIHGRRTPPLLRERAQSLDVRLRRDRPAGHAAALLTAPIEAPTPPRCERADAASERAQDGMVDEGVISDRANDAGRRFRSKTALVGIVW